jgi:large conductance mechanosensitive channel
MGMMQEFKEFAVKGNVVDMAVGVIIGGAFGKIVTSFTNDVIMPPIGLLMGNADFSQLYLPLKADAKAATLEEATKLGEPVIRYGAFINTVLDFVIVAFVIFMVIKQMNRVMGPKKA